MLIWMVGIVWFETIMAEETRARTGVVNITEKIREARKKGETGRLESVVTERQRNM